MQRRIRGSGHLSSDFSQWQPQELGSDPEAETAPPVESVPGCSAEAAETGPAPGRPARVAGCPMRGLAPQVFVDRLVELQVGPSDFWAESSRLPATSTAPCDP